MEMAKIRVGVNGYGTIGKRVATAVAAQDDMERETWANVVNTYQESLEEMEKMLQKFT